MIQRIQSIFIAGYIIFCAAALFLPLAEFGNTEKIITVSASSVSSNPPAVLDYYWHYALAVVAIMGVILGMRVLFLYKNRGVQMKMMRLGGFLSVLHIALIFFIIEHAQGHFFAEKTPIAYGFGVYFPLAATVMSFVANRFIKKDEDLIRSIDRLR